MNCALLTCVLLATTAAAQSKPSIVLPPKIIAGEIATLAVLDPSGALLPNSGVEFTGGVRVSTDSTGRARFTAPEAQGVLTAQLAGTPGTRASTVVIAAPPAAGEVVVRDFPHLISLHDRFNISGHGFSGLADANRVLLNGRQVVVMAASPVSLVIAAGATAAPGAVELTVANGAAVSMPVHLTLVAVEIDAPGTRVAPKQKSTLAIRARGSELPLEIAVQNMTPEVIEFTRGEPLRITTRGGVDNVATVEIRGRREGDYAISARLVPSAVGVPDLSAARTELIAAQKLTTAHGPAASTVRCAIWKSTLSTSSTCSTNWRGCLLTCRPPI